MNMFALKCGVYPRAAFNRINTVVSNFVDSGASRQKWAPARRRATRGGCEGGA